MSEPHGGAAGRNAGWGAGDGEGAPFKGGGREPVRYLDVPEQLSKLHAGLVLLAIPTRRTGRLVGGQQLAPHARLDRLAFRCWCCGLIRRDWFARPTTSFVRVQIDRPLVTASRWSSRGAISLHRLRA